MSMHVTSLNLVLSILDDLLIRSLACSSRCRSMPTAPCFATAATSARAKVKHACRLHVVKNEAASSLHAASAGFGYEHARHRTSLLASSLAHRS